MGSENVQTNAFPGLRGLPEPFGIKNYTDELGFYIRNPGYLNHEADEMGTQKTESRHLIPRTGIRRPAGRCC